MPIGPQGQKRPADPASNAVAVMQIATGQITAADASSGKNPAAMALGSLGGHARAGALSKTRRSEIAKKAAKKRWSYKKKRL